MNQALSHSACGAEPGLISVDQALQMLLEQTHILVAESLPLARALNRYLAEAIDSAIPLPLFSQSAVDGYALCSPENVSAHSTFELIGEIRAGQSTEIELRPGQAVRIFTGARIPAGTTTVARQEIVKCHANQIIITTDLKPHMDIRDADEEIAQGQRLADAGQKLHVGAIAALSMAGVKQVSVYRYPKIAVVITGDEVASSIEDLNSGKIFDANAPLIQAWFQSQGQNVDILHVSDNEYELQTLIHRLKHQYDFILTTGGVSVGDYDFIRPVALEQGFEQIFWKVKQKPGKPMLFAKYRRDDQGYCYLLGLPGNPAAVYVGMQIYTATLLNALQGQKQSPAWLSAVMTHDLKADARERFLRMAAEFDQGTLKLKSLAKQQSHMLSNLMQANCLVRIPAATEIQAGHVVQGLLI